MDSRPSVTCLYGRFGCAINLIMNIDFEGRIAFYSELRRMQRQVGKKGIDDFRLAVKDGRVAPGYGLSHKAGLIIINDYLNNNFEKPVYTEPTLFDNL